MSQQLLQVLLLLALAALTPWISRRPVRGLYLLVGGSILFELSYLGFKDSLTDQVPFFGTLSWMVGLSVSPAILLVLVTAMAWWIRGRDQPGAFRVPGHIALAVAAYAAVIALGILNGLLTGGGLATIQYEVKPQLFGLATLLLAAGLVRQRSDVTRLAAIVVLGIGFKGLLGYYRFVVTLQGQLGSLDSFMAHEESYFYAMFMVASAAALIWYRRRRWVLLMLALDPVVGYVMLENERRVALLALYAALGVLALITIRYERRLRLPMIAGVTAVALSVTAVTLIYWNHDGGLAGQIVRPIRSTIGQPDARDLSSNLYRVAENTNIIATYQTDRILGIGFGKPMELVVPMVDISEYYPYWQYVPHDTLLWIGMRMGILGYLAFWGLIGIALLEGCAQIARHTDGLLRGTAAFAMASIVGELLMGYGDLGLENPRELIFMGLAIGTIASLRALQEDVQEPLPAPEPARASPAWQTVTSTCSPG